MRLRRQREEVSDAGKWLEVTASMTGSLTFKDPVNLQINGQFDGTLDTKGNLSIGEKAQITATIRGERIIIGGTVTGQVSATTLVELLATARVMGKVAGPRLIVHEGAILHGTLDMIGRPPETPQMSVEELARFLEVDVSTVSQWAQEGRVPAQREGDQWRFDRKQIEAWVAQEKIR